MKKQSFLLLISIFQTLHALAFSEVVCVRNNATTNDVIITWNHRSEPCGAFQKYTLYASTSATGPFTPVDSTLIITDTTFTHTAALSASANWFYYVEVLYNCIPVFITKSDTTQNAAPVIPILTRVSIGPKGAIIEWEPSPSPQTCFYVIYYDSIRGNLERCDTVYGRLNTIFVDSNFIYDANLNPINYTVEANDCCGNNNGPVRIPQKTIYVQSSVLRCEGIVHLDWTPYVNWPNRVGFYNIAVSKNGSPFSVVASVDSNVLGYDYSDFNDFDSLCFIIIAVQKVNAVISLSNQICLRPSVVQKPKYLYLSNVTVNENEKLELQWIVDTLGEMYRYIIEDKSEGGVYLPNNEKIVSRPYYSEIDTFVDTLLNPAVRYFYYRVISDDSCSNKLKSLEGRSVHLALDLSNYYEFTLNWNAFLLGYSTVTSYEIWRDNGTGEQLLAVVDRSSANFVDDVSSLVNKGGFFCYRVIANHTLQLEDGRKFFFKARSNKVCESHRPIVYIPNAFVPGGVNSEFKPSIVFGDINGYSLSIFSRWGEELFVSNDVQTGWNGTKNGKDCPAGGYAYVIRFKGLDGNTSEYKGIVLLVR